MAVIVFVFISSFRGIMEKQSQTRFFVLFFQIMLLSASHTPFPLSQRFEGEGALFLYESRG